MSIRKKTTLLLLIIITMLSPLSTFKITYATEVEGNDSTSYSSNSTVTFVYSLSLEVRYVDENGNPLKEKKVIDGDEEKQFHIVAEEIDGYELKDTIGNPNGKFGEDFEVTFVYKKVNQNSNNNNNGNTQNNQNDDNNSSNNHQNDGNSNSNGNSNNSNSNNDNNGNNNSTNNNNTNNTNNTNNSTNTNNQNQSSNITQNKQQSSNNSQIIDGVKTGDYYFIIIVTISIGILLTVSGLMVLLKMKKKH